MVPQLTDLGSRPVRTVDPDDSLDRAMEIMQEAHLRHLPVVHGGDLVGMVSERDILRAVGGLPSDQRRGRRGGREITRGPTRAGQIMSLHPWALPLNANVYEAARLLIERKIGAVPLLKGQHVESIVSETDLLRALRDMSLSAGPRSPCYRPVREYMTRQVFTLPPTAEVTAAAEAFREKGFRHLPVLEEGKLVGLISDRDVRRALGIRSIFGERPQAGDEVLFGCRRVGDVMSAAPLSIHPDASLSEAAHVMLTEGLGSLCVVEHDVLVGIITETDLLRILAEPAGQA